MKQHYDIAIIGGGIGGLMTAFRITETDPSASVCGSVSRRLRHAFQTGQEYFGVRPAEFFSFCLCTL